MFVVSKIRTEHKNTLGAQSAQFLVLSLVVQKVTTRP